MSKAPHGPPRPLLKQQSWSPDIVRDESWQRRNNNYWSSGHCCLSRSLSEDDIEELKGCIELGFGFESPEIDPKLTETIPALGFYYAVNRQSSSNSLSRTSSSSSLVSDGDTGSSFSLFEPGDDFEVKKTRLRQWAQVVACVVRQSAAASHPTDQFNP